MEARCGRVHLSLLHFPPIMATSVHRPVVCLSALSLPILHEKPYGPRPAPESVQGFASLLLIAWLKEEDEDIGIAMKVVEAVWPRVCLGRAQAHLDWTQPCETKVDLIQVIESWVPGPHTMQCCTRHFGAVRPVWSAFSTQCTVNL